MFSLEYHLESAGSVVAAWTLSKFENFLEYLSSITCLLT